MKKTLYLLLVLAVSFTACNDDSGNDGGDAGPSFQLPQTQRAVMFHFTGTWCGDCGAVGDPALDQAITNNSNTLVPIECHVNAPTGGDTDPMTIAASNALAQAFAVTTHPSSYIGDNIFSYTSNVGANVNRIQDNMAPVIAEAPVVNTTLVSSSVNGTSIEVETRAEFFQALPGRTYKIAAYLLEDNVAERQATGNGQFDENATHDNVLRSVLTDTFGAPLATGGDATEGAIFDNTFTGTLDASWNASNLKVALVVWQQIGASNNNLINGSLHTIQ